MAPWPPADDDALTVELGAALWDTGPVPEEFLTAARAAFAWRTVDAELAVAELMFDSACDAEPAGLTRSGGSARTLSFRSGQVVLEIEVTEAGIVGQLSPPRGGRVTARTATGPYDESAVDEVGFFSLGAPPSGPVRLSARADGYAVATDWVSLG
ncbi:MULTISPECIES: hypothetical protein [Micromonospora]|jgi:hypothetical protein|uniref:Carboxypeptidase regulatory-like domain-containing protein n=1 Tax=Micromonospora carbonacea TaxID=47853 RepID=A0A1C5A133_9ACTN|nr:MULTISPECIES: hypothetical protein [Micromonospora]MBB5826747.1 hypothetical protein [Micromonospora carbonacea]MDG4819307.1 hypothetical protein [Micromonospora sp. WMMD956]QLD26228.1 hypothetical protein HXZ27_20090 [Micromonospora carbonacea]WFE55767.1 hypothetical protein O7633_02345 [Micromonospora sp. WMMD712]SCF38869.1 hypothetical protein GA0070563_110273 [Micromonospora carbonacea]